MTLSSVRGRAASTSGAGPSSRATSRSILGVPVVAVVADDPRSPAPSTPACSAPGCPPRSRGRCGGRPDVGGADVERDGAWPGSATSLDRPVRTERRAAGAERVRPHPLLPERALAETVGRVAARARRARAARAAARRPRRHRGDGQRRRSGVDRAGRRARTRRRRAARGRGRCSSSSGSSRRSGCTSTACSRSSTPACPTARG